MPDNPFSDREINEQIQASILRLQAASLEWDDNPAGSDFDDHIVETLVDSLNVHADAYLRKVDRKDLVTQYVDYIRGVGARLIWNAEQRSHLSDRYSDERLRKMAENTGGFLSRRHLLTPEQQEAEISHAMERFRTELREEAVKWHQWRNQMLFRIETRFEARYRHWAAESIDRVQRENEPPASKPEDPSLIGRLPKEAFNGGNRAGPIPQFPKRASWLKDRLRERSWNKHDVSRQGGPDHKTVQKILDGARVREDVLDKVAKALSTAPDSKKLPKVSLLDIPQG